MKLFCLDTSGPLLSMACLQDGEAIALWEGELPGRRSEQLLPKAVSMFEKLEWNPRQLDAVAVSRGPGSFTGLRVGLAFAKGLALDGTRILTHSTLEVWAQALLPGLEALGAKELAVLLDARRGQVYRGHFVLEGGVFQAQREAAMLDCPEPARQGLENAVLGGDLPQAPWEATWLARERPLAQGLAELAWARLQQDPQAGEEAALIRPDYLRRPEVEILWEKRQAQKTP